MTLFEQAEKYFSEYNKSRLNYLISYKGVTLKLFKANQTIERSVYGNHAGSEDGNFICEFKGLLTDAGSSFFSSSPSSSGGFQEAYLYTTLEEVNVGDLIEVKRLGKSKRYKVESNLTSGVTEVIAQKFKLTSVEI
jgi:hypothetical protein